MGEYVNPAKIFGENEIGRASSTRLCRKARFFYHSTDAERQSTDELLVNIFWKTFLHYSVIEYIFA